MPQNLKEVPYKKYSLLKRKDGKAIWSVRFRTLDKDNKPYVFRTVTADRLKMLTGDYSEGRVTTQRDARYYAEKTLEMGLVTNEPIPEQKPMKEWKLIDFCLYYWTWGESEYLKAKNAEGKRCKPEGAMNAYRRLKKYLPVYFPSNPLLSKVTLPMIEHMKKDLLLKGEIKNETLNMILTSLRTALKGAASDGLIDPSIPAGIANVGKGEQKERGILEAEEVEKVLDYLDTKYPKGTWDRWRYLTVGLGAYTGMRIAEVKALRTEDIVINEDYAYINVSHAYGAISGLKKPKNDKERITYAPFDFIKELAEYGQPDGWVFPSTCGNSSEPIGEGVIRRNFYTALSEAIGLSNEDREAKGWVYHALRHYANTWMLNHGFTEDETRRAIGHSSKSMTDRYFHITEEAKKNMATRINSALQRKPEEDDKI